MAAGRLVLLFILLIASFIFADFPGVKIVCYMIFTAVLFNLLYKKIVERSFTFERRTDTYKVFSGIAEPNVLSISSHSIIPIHALLVTDLIDGNISPEPKKTFFVSLGSKGEKSFAYPIIGRKRGKYKIGPTLIGFSDLMGLYKADYEADTVREVIVFPNIKKILNTPYKSMQPMGSIKNKVPVFEDPTMITGLKNYQFGDDIKKINWKVSAKHNKFMVNTYQPMISAASMVLLNLYENDYNFKSRDYYMESGIEAAAALIHEFFVLKQEVAFIANCRIDEDDSILSSAIGKGETHFTSILTDLAVMQSSRKVPFRNLVESTRPKLSWGMSLYVFTPVLDEVTLQHLINYKNSGHSITLVNLGPDIRRDMSFWNIGIQSFFADSEDNMISLIRI